MRLLLKLTWRSMLARPTLTVLAILLLAVSTALLYGLFVSVKALSAVKSSLIENLAIEIELSNPSDSTRLAMESRLRQRPDVLDVKSLSARDVLDEVELELGESLSDVLTENPFPPILRVKLLAPNPHLSKLFVEEVAAWPGVLRVVYPRDLWAKFDNWIASLKGRIGYLSLLFALFGWVLGGLSLRAILRNRRSAWQLFLLLGLRTRDLLIVQLLLAVTLGLLGGLLAATVLQSAFVIGAWLFAMPLHAPAGSIFGCVALCIVLAISANVWTPRDVFES